MGCRRAAGHPHVAGLSRDYLARLSRSFAENLQAFETGVKPPNRVNRRLGLLIWP